MIQKREAGRVEMAQKALMVTLGGVLALAVIALCSELVGSLGGDRAVESLPTELKEGFFVFEEDGTTAVYSLERGRYAPLSLGTIYPTTFLARRGAHVASVQVRPDGRYEARLDAKLAHLSDDPITSAAASPNGKTLVIAQGSLTPAVLNPGAQASSSRIMLIEEPNGTVTDIGSGFAPFFVTDEVIAWFSADGLISYSRTDGSRKVLDAEAVSWPRAYPGPAVSPDGSLVAWITASTREIQVARVTDEGATLAVTVNEVPSGIAALSNSALYLILPDQKGAVVVRYGLSEESSGVERISLPDARGPLVHLIPAP